VSDSLTERIFTCRNYNNPATAAVSSHIVSLLQQRETPIAHHHQAQGQVWNTKFEHNIPDAQEMRVKIKLNCKFTQSFFIISQHGL
jgi:hypothetical protein